MGAWGYGIYDNDRACDVESDLFKLIRTKSVHECYLELLKYYADDNEFYIVMADWFARSQTQIPFDINKIINEEIELARGYRDPIKRVQSIIAFKDKIEMYIK